MAMGSMATLVHDNKGTGPPPGAGSDFCDRAARLSVDGGSFCNPFRYRNFGTGGGAGSKGISWER